MTSNTGARAPSSSPLPSRTALIAGGTGGVGSAIVRALAEDGFSVCIGYRSNAAAAYNLAAEIDPTGGTAHVVRMDLDDQESVQGAVASTREKFGSIDAGIYAAGPFIPMRWIAEVSADAVESMLSQDTVAFARFLSGILPALRESKGSLTCLSTPAAHRHLKRDVLSAVPKAAVEALVRAVASEEGRNGVRANCVAVGFVEAGMYHELRATGEFDDAYVAAAIRNIPLRRMGTAEDIAAAVAFLAGPRAAYVTGQALAIDGGLGL